MVEIEKIGNVEIVRKNLDNFKGIAWLVKKGERYYAVSRADTFDRGDECLIFLSDDKGKVKSWRDICGGTGYSHEQAIEELSALTEERINEILD